MGLRSDSAWVGNAGMPPPTAFSTELTEGECEQLVSWSRRHTRAQALALRSRIVLVAETGASGSQLARDLGASVATVASGVTGPPWTGWMVRSTSRGRGRPRTITDVKVDEDHPDIGEHA